MRARLIVCCVLVGLAVSCRPDGDTQVSGISGVALPGRVIWAIALHPDRCDRTSCQATYRIRVTNTTDTDLYVPSCEVVKPPAPALTTLRITELAGLPVHGGDSRLWTASFQVDATPEKIHELAGSVLRCSGQVQPDDFPAAALTEP